MKRGLQVILIILIAVLVTGGLYYAKQYLAQHPMVKNDSERFMKPGDIAQISDSLKRDTTYQVKDVLYKDSAIFIAVANPEKTGTDQYFNTKYKLNDYGNINMVYIYQYDSLHKLKDVSADDALMATGKKMGRFQDQWVAAYIDTADKSCKPLKAVLTDKKKYPESFKNEETVYQPESIHKMHVNCKYRLKDDSGKELHSEVTAIVDSAGTVLSIK